MSPNLDGSLFLLPREMLKGHLQGYNFQFGLIEIKQIVSECTLVLVLMKLR